MRESLMYGSVRGARGNSRPYRDMRFAAVHESAVGSAPRRRESSVEEESTRRVVD
jgi:hypothetical protein